MIPDAAFDSEIKLLINSVDLSSVVNRMVKVNNWSRKQALEAADQYKNFLFLKRKYGGSYSLPPSSDIDEFWHNHILNTKKYEQDCNIIFSKYLHHHPHHGQDGEITQKTLENSFKEETQKLYFNEFGTYIYAIRPIPYKILLKKTFKQFKLFKIFSSFVVFLNFSRKM